MTPQDHNKVIGIMHLIWGGFNALTLLILVPIFLIIGGFVGSAPDAPPGLGIFFGLFGMFMAFLALVAGVPPVVAGYAMLKRKSWAKVAGIISACLCALSFPVGTALCVYTFWFLFSDGENFYNRPDAAAWRGSLRDANAADWQTWQASDARQKTDAPPPPPDWRS
ncbi:MAG TPA: hypothetical protein VE713_10695 [Pyrinomonadaceae bacterium]|jgi:hypothetical protein|nr:hypothetical protein [Pyrinomonadaceae bacterium]